MIIPDRHQVERKRLAAKLNYYGIQPENVDVHFPNRVLRENLQSFGISSVDVLDCLKKKFEENEKAFFYYVLDNHLTKEGNRAVAECSIDDLRIMIQEVLTN